MKLFYFILLLLFISCRKNQENKKLIEELESNIEFLESKIKYYESLDCDSINQYDNAVIKDIIFNNNEEFFHKFYPSGNYFYDKERYNFLLLNMHLLHHNNQYYSYYNYQNLSEIYYFKLNNPLKNSNLYYFALYFYALGVENDSKITNPENMLNSGITIDNVEPSEKYLLKAYE
jgi:hypothetical protein